MKIVDKYVIKETLKYMGVCLAIFTSIYLIIDFFQKIDDFMEAKVGNITVIKYFLYKLPFVVNQMCPVAILISVIVVFSLMKKNRELIALNASGISITKMYIPALILGLSITIASFFFSELVIPYTSSKAEALWIKEVRKGRYKRFFRRRHIWYKGKDSIYCIERFEGRKKMMEKAVFYFFDKKFHIIKRVQAKRVYWREGWWIGEDVIIQKKKKSGKGYEIERYETAKINISETPDSFLRPIRRPEEMNYWQLKRFAEQIKKEGYDAKRYFVDTYMKLSFPFINTVVILIGIPAALKIKRESISIAIAVGILICFVYIFFMGIFRSLGVSGIMPPFISAWITNVIFLFYGLYFMLHIDKLIIE